MRDFIAKSRFSNFFDFLLVPMGTGFINYFDEVDYLHFALISDAKVIASRLPPNILKVQNIGFASEI